ncbi:MAG TPA: pectate lyase [Prolixibacteraceae bacterium]|nr:pectate lyase [Prolixibacteraceae bacterium]
MKIRLIKVCFAVLIFCSLNAFTQEENNWSELAKNAEQSLGRGIEFMQSLAIEGGYVYHYTLDGIEKWGEGKTDDNTIEVQPPGTPAVGISFLKAFRVTGNENFLEAAKGAAGALIKGQNELGGWEHKIYFDRPKGKKVSFDDDQTQSAIRFLMALDQEIDWPELSEAVEKSLILMLNSQLENGGWPHQYPQQGNYHDYATFNDQGINDCIRVMLAASGYYDNDEYRKSLQKVGRFLVISQLPPPQPGWAQQYNEYLQPAWARSFEPPAVCPSATIHNINSLIELYEFTNNESYLEPIPDALRWLKASQLPNGKWGRFLEIGTNKPLYYDRGRIRVDSLHQLSLERRTGYGYETDIEDALRAAELRYLRSIGKTGPVSPPNKNAVLSELAQEVRKVIENQDEQGRWIVQNDKFRKGTPGYQWKGEYRVEDRISSALFNRNVALLCTFLEEYDKYLSGN